MRDDKLPIVAFSLTRSHHLETPLRVALADLQKIARYLVPPHHERKPIDASNVLYSILPVLSLLLMAGLARRRGTWLIRLALLPLALAVTLRMSFGHFIDNEYFYAFNHGYGKCIRILYVIISGIQLTHSRIEWGHHDRFPFEFRSPETRST